MRISEYNVKDRVRKFNMSKLTKEEADQLGEQIGDKLRVLVDETVEKANNFLKIYGMKAKMQVALESLDEESKG
jgi:hypothetical protein